MEAITFYRCRAVDPSGQYFHLPGCPAGQVINIQSAVLGYSQTYQPDAKPPRCPDRNCTVETDVPGINKCNGLQRCGINQEILLFPTYQLCDLQKDGNFIDIEYTCVTGMHFCCHFLYFVTMYHVQNNDSECTVISQ